MKYCRYCGRELHDEAVICPGCGCAAPAPGANNALKSQLKNNEEKFRVVKTLSERLMVNGVIWVVIGAIQIALGIILALEFQLYWTLAVGVLNVMSSIDDFSYSKKVLTDSSEAFKKLSPLTGPVIVLIYNIVIGGLIGVAGSIYYFVAIRSFVILNKDLFEA